MKQKLINGDEYDAVYARHYYHWKPGTLKRIKRALNKRLRREWKNSLGSGTSIVSKT